MGPKVSGFYYIPLYKLAIVGRDTHFLTCEIDALLIYKFTSLWWNKCGEYLMEQMRWIFNFSDIV